jgi:hypothetical protein
MRKRIARIGSESPGSPARHSYEIGYGKPPKHRQFPAGQSGNPKGRPKGRRNLRSVVEQAMNEKIPVRSGSREKMMTATEALVHTTRTRALKGDPKAVATMMALMRACGMLDEEPASTALEPVTANDAAVIAEFFRRQQYRHLDDPALERCPEHQPVCQSAADDDTNRQKDDER